MRSTRTIRAEIPPHVWDNLANEADAKGVAIGRHLRDLIEARDAKKYGARSSTAPTEGAS